MGMSIRAYARRRGVSHTAVQKAIHAGRISVEADGGIDPVKADAAWAANTTPIHGRQPQTYKQEPPQPQETAVRNTRNIPHETNIPISAATPEQYIKAKTSNEIVRAQTNSIRLQKLKGELIDRAKAIAQVFRFARQERDAWLNWPARISSVMAAEIGVDPNTLHTALEKHVRNHLSEMSDIKVSLR